MREKIKQHTETVKKFRKEHGKTKLGDANVGMVIISDLVDFIKLHLHAMLVKQMC